MKIKLRYSFVIVLACAITSLSFFLITSPIALQKILSLKPYNEELNLYNLEFSSIEEQRIYDFISSIPYKIESTDSWYVDPKQRYKDTILAGNGNCSNLAFGAMYAFIKSNEQAAIVHLFGKDYGFLYGSGHTVLSVNMNNQSLILDVLEGGIPLQNKYYIDVQHFKHNEEDVYTHQVISGRRDNQNAYFTNNYLQKIELGLIPQQEIIDYFNFIDLFYVPFGHTYLEKLFYDMLSLLFGYYPSTYVSENFFWEIYSEVRVKVFFAYVFLVSFHLLYIILILLLILRIWALYKKRILV